MDKVEASKLLTVTRSSLRKYCIRKMFDASPEYANSISSKLLRDALIYLEGYAEGVRPEIMPPYNSTDLKRLMLHQGFEYIKSQLITQ
jgi:hypothetical protein